MKAIIQQLYIYIVLFIIIFLPNTLFAENVTMTAVGEYVMGDNDTYTEAKKLALQDAKRILLEKVGTYIESKTEVKDGIVKSDEIKQYSAGIVKVEEVSDERSVLANKASLVKVNVKAIVDPDALIKQVISFRNRKDIEESAKKMSVDNNKLRKEIEQLNQQLRNVADEKKYQQLNAQRKEIIEQIDTNEKGLTLLLSGEGLFTAALLDRQKKIEENKKAKKFIKDLAAAYKLSASSLAVNDNGDDTATVTFTVKAYLPLNLRGIDGVDMDYLSSKKIYFNWPHDYGQAVQAFSIVCGAKGRRQFIWEHGEDVEEKMCRNIMQYICSELPSLVLSIKLEKYETKKALAECSQDCHMIYYFKNTYNIKMPLSELKSLSKLKLKIIYDSQEYGQ